MPLGPEFSGNQVTRGRLSTIKKSRLKLHLIKNLDLGPTVLMPLYMQLIHHCINAINVLLLILIACLDDACIHGQLWLEFCSKQVINSLLK